ncbi:uncharacterized protein LOC129224320 [Uloborus diversus]|uniref:uncharacterized protein LOC129224320 n=1 Tax=Uloborus diversus TaxID=327109 RepID=UPI00240941A8|nr:uncharacterized protein LOC129224320 [Uloborus diversus]
MNFIWLKPPENLLDNFDVELQDFYREVLSKEVSVTNRNNICKIKAALKEVVSAYTKETVDALSSRIKFDSAAKRFAYIFKHCPCFTSAVARHFKQILDNDQTILWNSLQRRKLNICCLGGGPASDAVAICRVVNSVQSWFWIRDPRPLEITVTVVDLNEGWKNTARNVLKTLEETPHFFDSEKMSLNFKFFSTDLTKPMNEEVQNVVKSADIVTMVYFVSAVNGSKVKDKAPQMIQQIMTNMKPGTLLFYLDSSKYLHYEGISAVAKSFKDLNQAYGPKLREFHTLSLNSVKRYFKIYSGIFQNYLCLTNCFVSVTAWTKMDELAINSEKGPCYQREIEEKISYGKNSWHKMMSYKSYKMFSFREKLRNLMMDEFGFPFFLEDVEEAENGTDCKKPQKLSTQHKIFYPTKSKRKRIYSDG